MHMARTPGTGAPDVTVPHDGDVDGCQPRALLAPAHRELLRRVPGRAVRPRLMVRPSGSPRCAGPADPHDSRRRPTVVNDVLRARLETRSPSVFAEGDPRGGRGRRRLHNVTRLAPSQPRPRDPHVGTSAVALTSGALEPPLHRDVQRTDRRHELARNRHRRASTGFSSVPRCSISMRTISPAFSHCGGFMSAPVPAGVPVANTSPGSSVNTEVRYSII